MSRAKTELIGQTIEERFAILEKEDEIERMLREVKARKSLPA